MDTDIVARRAAVQGETDAAVSGIAQGSGQVERGAELVMQAAHSLEEINRAAHEVGSHVQEIAGAADQQTQASHLIGNNMEQIAQMTESNAAAIKVTAQSAERLKTLAASLQHSVNRFRI